MTQIQKIQEDLKPLKKQLKEHKLYKNIDTVENVQTFMQMHIYAVWDFMSLVKSLQKELTSTQIPWVPNKGSKVSRRLINDIVLGEESDVDENNNIMSHFEMYINAMIQAKADTKDIQVFIDALGQGKELKEALSLINIKKEVRDFINFTFDIIDTKQTHKIAAVFTFGRENLIPTMFIEIVRKFNQNPNTDLSKFVYYLDRHIEVDGEEHGPMSLNMIEELCKDDKQKWAEAKEVCIQAMELRIKLWDCINTQIEL